MLLETKESRIEPDITVIALAGRLAQGRESQQLEGLMGDWIAGGLRKMIVDLTRVNYIDSAGIGMLALAAGQLKEHGGRLALVAGEGKVRALLRLTQLDALMPLCASIPDASGLLCGDPPAKA